MFRYVFMYSSTYQLLCLWFYNFIYKNGHILCCKLAYSFFKNLISNYYVDNYLYIFKDGANRKNENRRIASSWSGSLHYLVPYMWHWSCSEVTVIIFFSCILHCVDSVFICLVHLYSACYEKLIHFLQQARVNFICEYCLIRKDKFDFRTIPFHIFAYTFINSHLRIVCHR